MLVAAPSRMVTAIFRVQMHCLNGATIAILFPILNTRTVSSSVRLHSVVEVFVTKLTVAAVTRDHSFPQNMGGAVECCIARVSRFLSTLASTVVQTGLNQCSRNRFLPVSATLICDVNFFCMQFHTKPMFLCEFVYSYSRTKLQLCCGW